MKVIFFLEYYHPNIGGVETFFKNLVENLSSENHQITIITARPYPNSPLKEKQGNITIIRMPFRSRYLFTFLGFFYLIKHINKGDFIHTTSYNAAIPAFFAGKLFGKKVVVTFHEVWGQLWFELPYMSTVSKWGHYLFEQFLLKLPFDYFIGVSKNTSNNLQKAGVNTKRIRTIYNGLDYSEFPEKKDKKVSSIPYTFTYFGRLGISKGLDLIVEATKQLKQKTTQPFQLQLIIPKVPAPFLKIITDYISTHELTDFVILKHELPFQVLKRTLIAADCVLIPSYSEGFCFAAAECVAMHIPIISSDRAALKEVVSGQFIKMKNFSADGLTDAMQKAMENKWQYSPIKKFELQDTIDQYKDLYTTLYTPVKIITS